MIDETTYKALMSKNGTTEYVGQGLRAPAWTGVGVLILDAVTKILGNGGIGGRQDCATQRDLGYERELTSKDAKIGKLESQLYTDQQITELRKELTAATAAQAVINAQQTGVLGLLQSQVANLNAMTAPYIKQPVMAASEGALAYGPFAKTAAASGAAATAG